MFDVDGEIRRWRKRQERQTSLSPRELDELEDHLRARTRLELELNAALAPERAFAIARQALGEADEVSREFAKAGKPRWAAVGGGRVGGCTRLRGFCRSTISSERPTDTKCWRK